MLSKGFDILNTFRLKFGEGVSFLGLNDERFKTVRIAIHFLTPLENNSAAANALVPGLLLRASREYPDYTELGCHLADLYGASVYADVDRFGPLQVLSISGTCLADRFALEGEKLSEDLASLLCSMAFSPILYDRTFDVSGFEIERRQLLEAIDSEFGDKRILARKTATKMLLSPEYTCVSRYGEREEIERMTAKRCTDAWRVMTKKARIEISAIGNCDPKVIAEIFRPAAERLERQKSEFQFIALPEKPKPESRKDIQDVAQAKLVLGFRTGTNLLSKETDALRLVNVMLGGSPNSKLFMNVREGQSLCYYCSASFDSASGTILIDSGVAPEKVKKAREAVLREVDAMKHGDFTEDEVDNAKRYLRDAYRTVFDHAGAIDSWFLYRCFLDHIPTPDETADRIGMITREEIISAASRLSLSAEYLLTGGGVDA